MAHLRKSTVIHAPLERVYALAHDPSHWDDWFVGISEEKTVAEKGLHRYLTVGLPFPLTQRIEDDHIAAKEARWKTKADCPPQCAEESLKGTLLVLAAETDWRFKRANGDTELTVDLEYSLPESVLGRHVDPPVIEDLEARCLERSLENLRALCEEAA